MHHLEIISLMPLSFFPYGHSTLDACMWEEHSKNPDLIVVLSTNIRVECAVG